MKKYKIFVQESYALEVFKILYNHGYRWSTGSQEYHKVVLSHHSSFGIYIDEDIHYMANYETFKDMEAIELTAKDLDSELPYTTFYKRGHILSFNNQKYVVIEVINDHDLICISNDGYVARLQFTDKWEETSTLDFFTLYRKLLDDCN